MRVVTLRDPASSVAAEFVPEAGMIGTSLSDAGVELLGQRRGLDAYVTAGKTMGIPILYPWANRLGENTYTAEGVTATVTPGENGVRADPNGLPIHGVLAGYPRWRVTAESDDELTAELDFAADPQLLASFPYPHVLAVAVRLAERTLTVRTTVSATGDTAVPLCFGFHPYLRLPGVARGEWVIQTPPLRHLLLDGRGLPTGASGPAPAREEVLGDKAFDDAYDQVPDGAVFAVSGGGRRLEVRFERGYPATQIFAPTAEQIVCFEPMTAPTDALRRGGYRCARPGEPAVAQFSIRV
ncbi:aldose 1-epimerase [Mycobacterium nebraskense]|uniref:Aldose epimerase n=1 Tax=Mycobacterium nebraskense TaxID=244292 RepID=A0A0F5NDN8_9MYCO|nr:aldose 1-epimerase [Mycobacterium nebraskense]KKC04383.1 aldose epimerase [Mycobacterium nebraskense]KLO42096.1 aldose epimerase [Mycobacterium nebraskense]MBI2694685.1 aldose 1-epimerase [Mycobacterium nebraskense]MCV7117550.1 aldose 1-epimerase [Mycobacterium nebraskense]ORW17601.1 aldose epimerase [Mycobacterium nebraskense]